MWLSENRENIAAEHPDSPSNQFSEICKNIWKGVDPKTKKELMESEKIKKQKYDQDLKDWEISQGKPGMYHINSISIYEQKLQIILYHFLCPTYRFHF